jgi:hypothetical protein
VASIVRVTLTRDRANFERRHEALPRSGFDRDRPDAEAARTGKTSPPQFHAPTRRDARREFRNARDGALSSVRRAQSALFVEGIIPKDSGLFDAQFPGLVE